MEKPIRLRDISPQGKFIITHHLAALLGLPLYFIFAPPSLGLVAAVFVLLILTEIGIGAGYHRYYSHGAYKLKKGAEAVFLFFATMAIQGPVLKWASDHRMHHAHIDKEGDPYNVMKGFWHAHVFWTFSNKTKIDPKVVPDLLRNKLAVFQNKYYLTLAVLSNIFVSTMLTWWFGDLVGAFVLGWGLRILLSYHITWFINSLAHYWGEQSYSKELSARDNAILAVLTIVGEGYHNYHHTFPADYRNGVRKYHFDPVKWTIWTLHKLRLAHSLRSFREEYITEQLVNMDRKMLITKLAVIEQHPETFRELLARRTIETRLALESQIHTLADSLGAKRKEMALLMQQKRELRSMKPDAPKVAETKARLKRARESYARDWKNWTDLCTAILNVSKPKKLSAARSR